MFDFYPGLPHVFKVDYISGYERVSLYMYIYDSPMIAFLQPSGDQSVSATHGAIGGIPHAQLQALPYTPQVSGWYLFLKRLCPLHLPYFLNQMPMVLKMVTLGRTHEHVCKQMLMTITELALRPLCSTTSCCHTLKGCVYYCQPSSVISWGQLPRSRVSTRVYLTALCKNYM